MSEHHAPLAPSAAGRWGAQCAGSTALEAANPEAEKSQDAREGDASHWVGATTLRDLQQYKQARQFKIGMSDPAGTILDKEMLEGAEMFVDTVVEIIGSDALDTIHVEEKLTMHNLVHPVNEGTPDVWAISGGAHRAIPSAEIYLLDYKYGHRFVDAFENWQCIDYTAGVLERPELANIPWENIKVRIVIVQPRCYGRGDQVRHWETTAAKLRPYFDQLRNNAYLSMGPGAPTHVGPECRDCKGRHDCEALQRASEAAMDVGGLAVPVRMSPTAQAVELRMIQRAQELLKARATGLEAQVMANVRAGVAVPFFTLQAGEGRLAWTKPAAEVVVLGDMYGVDLRKEPEAITPTQAIKLGKAAGLTEDVVKSFAARPKGETKLIAADTEQARRVFGHDAG